MIKNYKRIKSKIAAIIKPIPIYSFLFNVSLNNKYDNSIEMGTSI